MPQKKTGSLGVDPGTLGQCRWQDCGQPCGFWDRFRWKMLFGWFLVVVVHKIGYPKVSKWLVDLPIQIYHQNLTQTKKVGKYCKIPWELSSWVMFRSWWDMLQWQQAGHEALIVLFQEIPHQLRLVGYPIIYRVFSWVLYIPGGCLGFLNHQQYHLIYRICRNTPFARCETSWICSFKWRVETSWCVQTHRIHVWYMDLHLPLKATKCR